MDSRATKLTQTVCEKTFLRNSRSLPVFFVPAMESADGIGKMLHKRSTRDGSLVPLPRLQTCDAPTAGEVGKCVLCLETRCHLTADNFEF